MRRLLVDSHRMELRGCRPDTGTSWHLLISLCFLVMPGFAAQLVDVSVLDRDILVVHLSDGDVVHDEGGSGEIITRHTPELNATAAAATASWTLTSADDASYGASGQHPSFCYRKTKLGGHAQMEWIGNDFRYEYTYEHWIYLQLPSSLQQDASYTLIIDPTIHSDVLSQSFTCDIFENRSEAIHVNLVGYVSNTPHKAADLYHWMGDGGARDYTSFEGNAVYLYDVGSEQSAEVGSVNFWMTSGSDVGGYNLTQSPVWTIDMDGVFTPGTYRLVVEGVGCSQDFEIRDTVYDDPFKISVLGYFYMRIGETNPTGISPPPRTPLYIPEVSPPDTTVYLTTMQPWHPDWTTFSSGDVWDRPNDWAAFRKPGNPTNADAWGAHSDAADWDRHLAHVVNIYDMLLPYLMTRGAISDDDIGITESGNSIPDILDEARNEVDFWLRLRDDQGGYSHGLTNPNDSHELFQAGPTAIAAWANAANASMLADGFRLAGLLSHMQHYRDEAVAAYNHADNLPDPMLDEGIGLDDGFLRGRDLKMMAAAFLYNVTGDPSYEAVVQTESVCAAGPAPLMNTSRHQLWATAGYLITPQTVNHPALRDHMQDAVVAQAMSEEAGRINSRPSRRGTDPRPAYWRTAQNMGRTIVAHAVAYDPADAAFFLKGLCLEADWGLGRNPLNMIEMTTVTTTLETKRSVTEAYTSGREDGVPGVHPGHTPYMNLDDWAPSMVMGRPSALYQNSYPGNVPSTWPRGETYYPSRWVWAHNEFTPRQTMRGKMALYGYLCGLTRTGSATDATLIVMNQGLAGATGTVSSSPPGIDCGTNCSHTFPLNTPVTLTASPGDDSVFLSWDDGCFGTQEPCEMIMTTDRAVTATFAPAGITHTLNVAKTGTGAGTVASTPAGIQCGLQCSGVFLDGEEVVLTATAEAGSTFTGWQGACSGTDPCTLTMNGDLMVSAEFMSNAVSPVVIYDEALGNGWQDWSWSATIDLAGTSPVFQGTHAVNIYLQGWGGFSPAHASGPIDTFGQDAIRFWVHGGTGDNKALRFTSEGDDGTSVAVPFTAVAGAWNEIIITLEQLGYPSTISRLNFVNTTGNTLGMITLDHIRMEPESALFSNGFESGDTSAWSQVFP